MDQNELREETEWNKDEQAGKLPSRELKRKKQAENRIERKNINKFEKLRKPIGINLRWKGKREKNWRELEYN